MNPKVNQRLELVLWLRDGKAYSFKEISCRIGVCRQRVCEIYRQAKLVAQRGPFWSDGLSIRACNCLGNIGITSKAEVCAAIMTGRLAGRGPHLRGYGKKTHAEVLKWLKECEPVALAFTIDVADNISSNGTACARSGGGDKKSSRSGCS